MAIRGAVTVILLPLCFLQNESAPAILIPMLQRAQAEGKAPRLLASFCCALTLAAVAVMLGVQALGAWWIDLTLGGFTPEGKALTLSYVTIMSWAMPASVLANTLAAGEIALGKTRLSNLRAGLLNLAMIIGLAFYSLSGWFGALAWPFTLSFNALALFGLWSHYREGTLDPSGARPSAIVVAGRDFLWSLRPLLALPFAEQTQVWIERLAASRNATGAVASLDYARTLSDTATLLISQPVGLAYMSSYKKDESHHQLEGIVRLILVVTVPASAFVYVFASDIVRLVFFRGAFAETGLLLTSATLQGVAIGLWASTLGWILLRRLNSEGRNGRATLIVVSAYFVNISLNAIGAWLAPPLGLGMLLIGLGESARSLTLLIGTTWALPNQRKILSLIGIAAAPGGAMLAVGWLIEAQAGAVAPRLLAGGVACAFFTLAGAFVLLPELRGRCFSKLSIWLGPGERPSSLASTLTDVLPMEALLRPIGTLSDVATGARGCLFTFHRAAPSAFWERLPNRNFYLDLAYLDRLLGYLKAQGWSIVTVEEAIERAAADRPGDRFVNFSVDDCYRDTFEQVVPLFQKRQAPGHALCDHGNSRWNLATVAFGGRSHSPGPGSHRARRQDVGGRNSARQTPRLCRDRAELGGAARRRALFRLLRGQSLRRGDAARGARHFLGNAGNAGARSARRDRRAYGRSSARVDARRAGRARGARGLPSEALRKARERHSPFRLSLRPRSGRRRARFRARSARRNSPPRPRRARA